MGTACDACNKWVQCMRYVYTLLFIVSIPDLKMQGSKSSVFVWFFYVRTIMFPSYWISWNRTTSWRPLLLPLPHLYNAIPYHIKPHTHHTIPYHIMPHTYHATHIPCYTTPYHTELHHTLPYHTIPYHTQRPLLLLPLPHPGPITQSPTSLHVPWTMGITIKSQIILD